MSDAATTSPAPFPYRRLLYTLAGFSVFWLVAWYSISISHYSTTYDDQRATERYATLAKLKATEEKTLTTADWVDQTKGLVRIPIDEAMTKEIPLLQVKPVQMGSAIAGMAPPATPMAPMQSQPSSATAAKTGPTNAPAAAGGPATNAAPAAATPPPPAKTTP
jgi:hypothetical protein